MFAVQLDNQAKASLCAWENVMGHLGLKVAKILILQVFQRICCPAAAVAATSGMTAHFHLTLVIKKYWLKGNNSIH